MVNYLNLFNESITSFRRVYKVIVILSFFPMGQINKQLPRQKQLQQLQLIDQSQGLYLNTHNNKVYLKNNVVINLADIDYEKEVYMFRRVNDEYVVSVDYCSTNSNIQMCSSFSLFTYFVEKPEFTLFQSYQSSFHDGIVLLKKALRGFGILYDKFGYFTPTSKLIFFDMQKNCKVWISEDVKTTRNMQNPHCPKNLTLQNTFIREVVHLFDGLRDPNHPMLRYSQFLPNELLRFNSFQARLFVSIASYLQSNQNRTSVSSSSTSVRLLDSDKMVSQRFSSLLSPTKRSIMSEQLPNHHNVMSFTLNGPARQIYPVRQVDSVRDQMQLNIKNTSKETAQTALPVASPVFASTMPSSLRNSKISQRVLREYPPFQQRVVNDESMIGKESNDSKRNSTKRLFQGTPSIFRQQAKGRLGNRSSIQVQPMAQYSKSESLQSFANPSNKTNNDNAHQQFVQRCHINPDLNTNFVPSEFRTHKRHQTDITYLQKVQNGSVAGMNQMFADSDLNHFHLNTIKSINLSERDREFEKEIVADLKSIIKRYRERQ